MEKLFVATASYLTYHTCHDIAASLRSWISRTKGRANNNNNCNESPLCMDELVIVSPWTCTWMAVIMLPWVIIWITRFSESCIVHIRMGNSAAHSYTTFASRVVGQPQGIITCKHQIPSCCRTHADCQHTSVVILQNTINLCVSVYVRWNRQTGSYFLLPSSQKVVLLRAQHKENDVGYDALRNSTT